MLILGGALFLAQNLGYIGELSSQFWMAAFGGASLLFFVAYFLSGVQQWGWLFPASIFAALCLTLYLAEARVHGAIIAAPVLASVGLPFLVAFALDPRKRWWALIPAWVMGMLTLLMLVVEQVAGETIGALVLFSIALPFLVVFLANRSRAWALIPALVLGAIGTMLLLINRINDESIASSVLFMIALPFFVVYFWSPKNWWALIPAGILSSIGISLVYFFGGQDTIQREAFMTGLMFLGWGITFGVLWLQRANQPTDWAKYPAAGFLAAALLSFVLRSNFQIFWPLVIIVLGVWTLYRSLRPRLAL